LLRNRRIGIVIPTEAKAEKINARKTSKFNSPKTFSTATEAPDLGFPTKNKLFKEKISFDKLIEEIVAKKFFGSFKLNKVKARTEAWLTPTPGKNPTIKPKTLPKKQDFMNSPTFISILASIFCFGKKDFSFKLIIKVDKPKNPESMGNIKLEDGKGEFKTSKPKIPERKKMKIEERIFLKELSLKIIKVTIKKIG